jgi:type VI secretion system secreted protein Hcp
MNGASFRKPGGGVSSRRRVLAEGRAVPIYMKYGDKIKGEAKAPYAGWIELQSVQTGIGRTGSQVGRGQGATREARAPQITELVATKYHDGSSPLLFQETLYGKGVDVMIDFTRTDPPERYLRITLKGCLISGFQMSGAGAGNEKPLESMSLNCESITWETTTHPPGPTP